MRRARNRGADDADVDMTPMLDIVFIMLIFFIVTATFLDEQAIEVIVPDNNANPENSEPKPAIGIYINETSLCTVEGRTTSCDGVPLSVEKLLAEKPGANIIMRVNKASRHETMVKLKDQFDSSGLTVIIEPVETPS